jgi:pimeloyl-ACP methyl ester carboxylesterase
MSIAWHDYGVGEPVVLLHGGHGSWQHWVRNVDALAKRYRVLIPDLPGYGDSDNTPEPTMASLVDTTREAIDNKLGAHTSIRLVGFSFGGLVAALIAAKRERISHLSLLGPAGHGTTRRPIGKLLDWKDALQANDDVALRKLMRHNLLMHMLANESSLDSAALDIHTQACLKARFFSKKISRAGGLLEALVAARQINSQMAISSLWGEHDVTCTPQDVQRLIEMQVGLQMSHIIPAMGHWIQYEAAELTNSFLLKALR